MCRANPLLSLFLLSATTLSGFSIVTDIDDCVEIDIRGSQFHPSINGVYKRLDEDYNQVAVFESSDERESSRYIWWAQWETFSRWSIGTEKFSRSIEGFLDNVRDEARILSTPNSNNWKVVHEGKWLEESGMKAICSKKRTQEMEAPSPDSAVPNMGAVPPLDSNTAPVTEAQELLVSGAKHALVNGLYRRLRTHDGYPSYEQRSGNGLFIFHKTYNDQNRWYIGSHLGADDSIYVYKRELLGDLLKDSNAIDANNLWREHDPDSRSWVTTDQLTVKRSVVGGGNNAPAVTPPPKNGNSAPNIDNSVPDIGRAPPPRKRVEMTEEEKKEQREKQEEQRQKMFRRVNKLDTEIETEGLKEANVDISELFPVIIVGSDNSAVNGIYEPQPIRFNERAVYKSHTNSYLFAVKYAAKDGWRWQVGFPDAGLQSERPLAMVNTASEEPSEIPTWQAWVTWNEESEEFQRQSRTNIYDARCKVTIKNAKNPALAGDWEITPETIGHRPVFEKRDANDKRKRMTLWMHETDNDFMRWIVSPSHKQAGDLRDALALKMSGALTPDGTSSYERWHEYSSSAKDMLENAEMEVGGNCAKVREHDWRARRRRARVKQEQAKLEAMSRQQSDKAVDCNCPKDMSLSNDKGEKGAVVHWQLPLPSEVDKVQVALDDDAYAPGSFFSLGKTAVTYQLKNADTGLHVCTCDFVITVKDTEGPRLECGAGEVFVMTAFNSAVGVIQYKWPTLADDGDDAEVRKISGPDIGDERKIGEYPVVFEAVDKRNGNKNQCSIHVVVMDKQAPKIHNCPRSIDLKVYEENDWTAFPEWQPPTAFDFIDGEVAVTQKSGPLSAAPFRLQPGETERAERVIYEARDKSQNVNGCSFRISIRKDTDTDNSDAHGDGRAQLGTEKDISDDDERETYERMHPRKTGNRAEDLRAAQRKRREERRNRRRAHRSAKHQKVNSKEEDAERRRLRSERRARRKGESGVLPIGRVLSNLIRPWLWPWPVFIPFAIVLIVAAAVFLYFLFEEFSAPMGRRVPNYNSVYYQIVSFCRRRTKTAKSRV